MTVLPTPTEAAWHWHLLSNLFWTIDQLATPAWGFVALASGHAVRLERRLAGALRRRWLAVAIVFAAWFTVDRLVHGIVNLAWDRAHDHALGRASADLGDGLAGAIVGGAVTVAAATALALALRAVALRAPRTGWRWGGALGAAGIVVAFAVQPLFTPASTLGDGATERAIVDAAQRAGVPADRLFASHCDAPGACSAGEVIGVGPTRRVLLDIELLRTLPASWARQTMAHEAHHALVDDNARALPVLAALAFAAAWLALRGTALLVERFRNHLGFDDLASAGALPLAALLLGVAWFALQPPLNLWRQHVEVDADRFALQTTCDASAQAAMLAHFAAEPGRLPQPSLYYRLFRDGHPSDAERIGLADDFDVARCVARQAATATATR